jgi:bifunctional non-homologous end joining protein LigD
MLMRRPGIPITFVVFDVHTLNGDNLTGLPYSERRAILESLNLNGSYWTTPTTFDDGDACFAAVQERELEGVVAKRLSSRYSPAVRAWVKIKNRSYWRYEIECESAVSRRRQRSFV